MTTPARQLQVDNERRRMAHHDAVSLRRDSWLEGFEEGRSLGICEGRSLGIYEGRRLVFVKMLIAKLLAHGFSLNETLRARIEAEPDVERLKSWLVQAAGSASVEELLNDEVQRG